MRKQADACYLDLIKFDKYAVSNLCVCDTGIGNAVITPKNMGSYLLPSYVVFILEWCKDHGINAIVITYLSRPAIKFETYAK